MSARIGERMLLPAVRRADAFTLNVADGFSCREQIAQMTGRRALHLAEVAQLALHENLHEPAPYAESRLLSQRPGHDAVPPHWAGAALVRVLGGSRRRDDHGARIGQVPAGIW